MGLNLSDGEFTGSYSLATLASALLEIWLGALVDRIDLGVSMETPALAAASYVFLTSALAWHACRSHSQSQSLDISQGAPPPL